MSFNNVSTMRTFFRNLCHQHQIFADTLHNHGGLTNGHKKGGVIIVFTPKVEALEKPIGTNEQTTTPPVYDM